jgi:PAS fold
MATGDSELERALAGGKPHPTGWFRLYFEDERWEWSPEVERLHGYEPGTAKPTTSMVLSHKHPEDYEQVAATLDEIRRTHRAFSTRHRIIDVQGRIHEVIVVAELLRDEGGEVIGTDGFYVASRPRSAKRSSATPSPRSRRTGPSSSKSRAS